MTEKQRIDALAKSVLGYLLGDGREREDFIECFIDEDWDDAPVEKALGMKPGTLTEAQADVLIQTSFRDNVTSLDEVVAYHFTGSHVYSDAVKLNVLMGYQMVPTLEAWELEHINLDLKDADHATE